MHACSPRLGFNAPPHPSVRERSRRPPLRPRAVRHGEPIVLAEDPQACRLPKSDAFGEVTVRLPGRRHARLGQQEEGRPEAVSVRSFEREGAERHFDSIDALVGGAEVGPLVEMQPHGSRFKRPVQVSLDIASLVQHPAQGEERVLLVLRQAGPDEPWLPLAENEKLEVDSRGIATVQLRSFSRFSCAMFSSVKDAAKAKCRALEGAVSNVARRGVEKVANANPAVVNTIVKYGAMAAGAAISAATVATGGVAGLVLTGAAGKIEELVNNPGCVQSFCKEVQKKLEEPGGLGQALTDTVKEIAAHKGLDKLWPDLEPIFAGMGLAYEQVEAFLLKLDVKQLKQAALHPLDTAEALVRKNILALLRPVLEPVMEQEPVFQELVR